jgi:predicted SAM-dependent methyltransferase
MPDEDRVTKRLNMGCGLQKFDNFVNVDKNERVKPDIQMDLNQFPWNFKDDEFDHIFAKDILEHIGETKNDLVKAIKEMYRISANGAIWEVQVPHWRCDTALDDPTHKHLITVGFFHLFNKRNLFDRAQAGQTESLIAFDEDVDIEVCDVQFEYTAPWQQRIKEGKITQDELTHALNHLNNVALSVRILLQVHKPGRIDNSELQRVLDEKRT